MYEEFNTLEEAESRAKVIYPEVQFTLTLGSAWIANGYIYIADDKYRLLTDV